MANSNAGAELEVEELPWAAAADGPLEPRFLDVEVDDEVIPPPVNGDDVAPTPPSLAVVVVVVSL